MGPVRHAIVIALLVLGCGVTVLSASAMLWITRLWERLHLLAPVSSVGVPLVIAALVVGSKWSLSSGLLLVIGVLGVLTGPAIGMATARAGKQREQGAAEAPE